MNVGSYIFGCAVSFILGGGVGLVLMACVSAKKDDDCDSCFYKDWFDNTEEGE